VLRTMIQRTGCPPAEGRLLSLWMRPRRALAVAMPVLALFAVAPRHIDAPAAQETARRTSRSARSLRLGWIVGSRGCEDPRVHHDVAASSFTCRERRRL
jgi:hypothetical protein